MSEEGGAWHEVAEFSQLDAEYPSMATIGELEIALCKSAEQVFAVANVCTHAFARLSDGFLDGIELICPLHQGSFDIRSGKPIAPPCTEAIAAYAVVIKDGKVFVDITRPPPTPTE